MKKIFTLVCAVGMATMAFAQDIVVTRDSKKIDAKILEVSKSEIKYKESDNLEGPTFILETSDISSIIYGNGKVQLFESTSSEKKSEENKGAFDAATQTVRSVDLENYHGYLMGKGNNVYVTTVGEADYEKAGAESLKKTLKTRHFWNVVENIEEAHFIIQFGVCLSGMDRIFLFARTREGYEQYPIPTYDINLLTTKEPGTLIIGVAMNGSEDGTRNAAAAQQMGNSTFISSLEIEDDDPILESLKTGAYPKHATCYTRATSRVRGSIPYAIVAGKKPFQDWLQFYKQ